MRVPESLQAALGHGFRQPKLLAEALRHRSYVNENPPDGLADNERLEFLGDAVLGLAVGHLLMDNRPDLSEGDLSRTRAGLVNETQLADIARSLEIGNHLQLGRGERQTGGQNKNSILADAFEAVVAAIYLDGGFDAAFDFVRRQFSGLLDTVGPAASETDFKSRLQERMQLSHHITPTYHVVAEHGPDHDKTFVVGVTAGELEAQGQGKSKKMAEQAAAQKALEILDGE
jgi:ribonuclease III